MKWIIILTATLLLSMLAHSQKTDGMYQCIPCGRDCDKIEYATKSKCLHCGMEMVPASTILFTQIPATTICDYIAGNPNTILLDVRTQEEFEGKANPNFGTLRGSINIPIQELSQRIAELKKYEGKEILVFCSHSHRSPQAAYLLTQQGFTKVVNMSEGLSAVGTVDCKK